MSSIHINKTLKKEVSMGAAAMGMMVGEVNLFDEAVVENCREIIAEYRATKIKAHRYNDDESFLLSDLVEWVDEEEKRLGRELIDEEIDRERRNLVAMYKKVKAYSEATRLPLAELSAWIDEEEEPWFDEDDDEYHQKELTDDEIERKRDELMAKYGVEYYK